MATMGGETTDDASEAEAAPLSRRDHFAAAALQGMLAHGGPSDRQGLCVAAVEYAEELIETLDAKA